MTPYKALACFFLCAPPLFAPTTVQAFCAPSTTTGISCLQAADKTCDALGATTMDGDKQNLIACLGTPAGSDCAAGQCQWKAMTNTAAVGTLCGSVFWEVNSSVGCTNVQNRATCMGQPLMTSCGSVVCPSGYTASQIGYSWGNNSGAYTYSYNQYTCVKS